MSSITRKGSDKTGSSRSGAGAGDPSSLAAERLADYTGAQHHHGSAGIAGHGAGLGGHTAGLGGHTAAGSIVTGLQTGGSTSVGGNLSTQAASSAGGGMSGNMSSGPGSPEGEGLIASPSGGGSPGQEIAELTAGMDTLSTGLTPNNPLQIKEPSHVKVSV